MKERCQRQLPPLVFLYEEESGFWDYLSRGKKLKSAPLQKGRLIEKNLRCMELHGFKGAHLVIVDANCLKDPLSPLLAQIPLPVCLGRYSQSLTHLASLTKES